MLLFRNLHFAVQVPQLDMDQDAPLLGWCFRRQLPRAMLLEQFELSSTAKLRALLPAYMMQASVLRAGSDPV